MGKWVRSATVYVVLLYKVQGAHVVLANLLRRLRPGAAVSQTTQAGIHPAERGRQRRFEDPPREQNSHNLGTQLSSLGDHL